MAVNEPISQQAQLGSYERGVHLVPENLFVLVLHYWITLHRNEPRDNVGDLRRRIFGGIWGTSSFVVQFRFTFIPHVPA